MGGLLSRYGHQPIPLNIMYLAYDQKLISHLKNMTQVAGKFAFLKPDEELLIWYRLVVSCDLDGALTIIPFVDQAR